MVRVHFFEKKIIFREKGDEIGAIDGSRNVLTTKLIFINTLYQYLLECF
jgi:hypothetical protein